MNLQRVAAVALMLAGTRAGLANDTKPPPAGPSIYDLDAEHLCIHLHDRDAAARPFSLQNMSVAEVVRAAVELIQDRPTWRTLRKLLE